MHPARRLDTPGASALSFRRAETGRQTDVGVPRRDRHFIMNSRLHRLIKGLTGITRKAVRKLHRDIRKPPEKRDILQAGEIPLRIIAASVSDAVLLMDLEGRISYWNHAAERILGYTSREALGSNLFELIAPEAPHHAGRQAMSDFHRTDCGRPAGRVLELTAIRKDGRDFPVCLTLSPVRIKDVCHAVGILRDITDRKQIEESLVRAKEETDRANLQREAAIEHANRMASEAQAAHLAKTRFLANMSHEIRTPMNGIMGMTELLLTAGLSDEKRRFAETLKLSAEDLLRVIEDILDFSMIESEHLDLENLDFDLRITLEDILDILGPRAREKKIEFICRIDPNLPALLRGDPARLRQVLLKLAENAVKFTPTGEVVVSAATESETEDCAQIRFEVRDTGIGIPAEKMNRLFEAFHQIDASTTRSFGGSGLGLTIANRLVEIMGGKIDVKSKEGEGSTFGFTIPFEKQPDSPEAGSEAHRDLSGVRILTVDDNATNRLVLAEHMASWGARHTEVESAAKALDALRDSHAAGDPFRITVIDMHMPKIDGEALGQAIKNDPLLKDTLLVMMTSAGRRGDVRRLKALGFSAYLTKPIKPTQLHDGLVDVLSGRRLSSRSEPVLVTRFTIRESRHKKGRILLAEDNAINRMVAQNILEKMGFRVDAVANGREAVQAMERFPYNLVFMDIQMPVMDGFETTRIIRSGRTKIADPSIPIIAMTAHALQGDRDRCLAAGMDDYIAKPIAPEDLENVLTRWLDRIKKRVQRTPPALKPPALLKDTPVFDKKAFLARLMNDKALAANIVQGFIEDMAEQIESLKQSAGRGDMKDIFLQAHKIKGSAANMGGMAASAAAFQLEKAAKTNKKDEIAQLVLQMECQLRLLKTRLRKAFP